MEWVGQLNHPILGKDKAHRYMPKERAQIIKYKLRLFTFSSGNINRMKMAAMLRPVLPRIERLALKQTPPFVAAITESGVHLRSSLDDKEKDEDRGDGT
jgi:hypothetical protein